MGWAAARVAVNELEQSSGRTLYLGIQIFYFLITRKIFHDTATFYFDKAICCYFILKGKVLASLMLLRVSLEYAQAMRAIIDLFRRSWLAVAAKLSAIMSKSILLGGRRGYNERVGTS